MSPYFHHIAFTRLPHGYACLLFVATASFIAFTAIFPSICHCPCSACYIIY